MPFYRRRYRRRFYRRYRKYSKWSKKASAASSLRQMSLPIRKTLSVTFSVEGGSFLSGIVTLPAIPMLNISEPNALVQGNQPYAALAGIFDQVRVKNFSIQITPGLASGFPPGALLICPDRKRHWTGSNPEAPTADQLLVSPSTQVVGFTQFSTLQTKRSLYAASIVERQSFVSTTSLDGSLLEFNPAFYLAIRLASSPNSAISIPCTITLTGTLVFKNPTN